MPDLSLDRHVLQEIVTKNVKPRSRRELAEWAQQVHRMSQRRVARLIPIERMTLRYEHHCFDFPVQEESLIDVSGGCRASRTGRNAPINQQCLPGDVRTRIGREEDDRTIKVVWLPWPL